jgi:hypothetical protein
LLDLLVQLDSRERHAFFFAAVFFAADFLTAAFIPVMVRYGDAKRN